MIRRISSAKGRALVSARPSRVGEVVSAFESETVAVFERTAPTSEHIVLYVLLGMVVLFVVLSAVVKLDIVVTGPGAVIPISGQIYVSPLDRAIIRKVNVKIGDVVTKGTALATLDPT